MWVSSVKNCFARVETDKENKLFYLVLQDVEKMILANKCDMEEKRVISKERGESIARENGVR